MSLDSTSSIAEVKAAYADNASYDLDGSVAKAKEFIVAVRIMLAWPKRERMGGGGSASEFEVDAVELRRQLDEARDYVAANRTDGAPAVLDVDFTEFDTRA